MKCILHIGTEKTGSSAIQNWLHQNKQSLSYQKIYISNILGLKNHRKLVAYFQNNFDDFYRANLISTIDEKYTFFKDFEKNFTEEIDKAKETHDTIIISSEHFHSRLTDFDSIVNLRNYLFNYFDEVRVVCYFREQEQMQRSLYSTAVRLFFTDSIQEFEKNHAKRYYYNFYEIANLWSDIFGISNCFFRIYDTDFFKNKSLIHDFADCLYSKIDLSDMNFIDSEINNSLTHMESTIYRLINKIEPYWLPGNSGVNKLNLIMKEAIKRGDSYKRGVIPKKINNPIQLVYFESNVNFFDKFFNGNYLFKDNLKIQNSIEPSSFTKNDILNVFKDCFDIKIEEDFDL